MKHTIKNPLVLRYTESDKISTNPRPIIKTRELVSKEIAQELAEALKCAKKALMYRFDNDIERAIEKLNQALKNANS